METKAARTALAVGVHMMWVKKRYVFLCAGLFAALLAVMVAGSVLKTPPKISPSVLGRSGEWVTRPDGRRVCRLSGDLMIYHRIDQSFCTDWQEPEPAIGQVVDGWVRGNPVGGSYQIMIEGRWRP